MKPFVNEPTLELRRAPARESLLGALRELEPQLPLAVPLLIGRERGAHEGFESSDPGEPDRVVATAGKATEEDAARAVEAAAAAFPAWRDLGAERRAGLAQRLHERERGRGRLLGRLQHHAVARGEGG